MKTKSIREMGKHKKYNKAVFLGCGSTINDIKDWDKFKGYDVWTSNNWLYHPTFVPDFYHVELKKYDYPIFKERLAEKRHMYKDCVFFFHKDMVYGAFPRGMITYQYKVKRLRTHERRDCNANYQMQKGENISALYCASFTSILEIMYRFGYKDIILFGVELNNAKYFWTDLNQPPGDPDVFDKPYFTKKYGKVHHNTNKERSPDHHHNTAHIAKFIVDFHHKWMRPRGRNLYVGTRKTLLFPALQYVEL